MLQVRTPNHLVLGLLTLSIIILAAAWGYELIGGYQPCPLCLQQRWAYYFAIPAAIVALLTLRLPKNTAATIIIALIAIAFAYNSALGIYHSGIEWKLWEGPAECSGNLGDISGSLIERLNQKRIVLCNEAPWRFLGLSFAGYNALFSAGLCVLALATLLRIRRNA